MTQRRIVQNPMYPAEAIRLVRAWLDAPQVQILVPGESFASIFLGLLEHTGTASDLTTDAHLAALATEYHAELVSTDTDFGRFPKLRWYNPAKV